ncbi:MAG TPA: molybdenum cofactor guanylyltransferase [Candidatus Binataceae bacterium]|nr:molybdenum cofactor guanylyltransferase [Candidatus Binataceae bacterium]
MNRRSAIVLAGGRSSRMGVDKAALAWGGATMLERVLAELARSFDDLVVVAGPCQGAAASSLCGVTARLVWDSQAFEGPVTALRLGLATVHAEVAFACACDLPFVNATLAFALCEMATDHDAAIPLVHGRLQGLHAAYRKSCLPALESMIGCGARKLQDLAPLLDARIVTEDELRSHDPELLSFLNVNTPEDYAQALGLAKKPVR